ncbi:MAG: SusC/RagA family TonB-linked outer membrane protein [Bacteroidales bacterium]
MKKNNPFRELFYRSLKKTLLTMRIAVILMILGILQARANDAYSQKTRLSLNFSETELVKVLDKIEVESEFFFLYNEKLLDTYRKVTITAKDQLISVILDDLFNGTDVKYTIIDRKIILAPDYLIEVSQPQQVKISGTVTDASTREAMAGVNIQVKGTTIGTISDVNGKYSIPSAVDQNAILIFSFIGYVAQEITVAGKIVIDVKLSGELTTLKEVVVTALGIKREAKSLGYSATSLDTKQFTAAREINVGNNLIGKVAGMNVSIPPSGPGGSSKIRIRGQSSFGGNNTPLVVINGVPINNVPGESMRSDSRTDVGDGLQSINPEDIESMTVLKGASAAALYGFRAKDGVIIITTKSGRDQSGLGVELNSSFQADEPLDYTDFQYEYGQGESGVRTQSVAEAHKTGVWSFGTKFDGLPIWQVDGTEKPYLPFKDRIKTFYDTGLTFTNSVAISGGNDKGSFRLSFSNTDAKSIVPNSKFNKKIMDLGLNHKLSEKLSIQVNANYSIEAFKNPPSIGGQTYNIANTIYTMATSIDPRWLEFPYKDPVTGNESQLARFTNRTNPYWTIYERFENRKRNRIFGNATLKYQFAPWLYAQGRVGQDYFTVLHDANNPTGTTSIGPAVTGFNGGFYQAAENFREGNMDFLVGANKKFGAFGIDVTLGGNSLDQIAQTLSTSVTNFYVRGLYTIGNGQIKDPNFTYSRKKVNSLYATMDLSFKDYLFLNVTGRNDWFSTLNPKSNSYLYPSVSTSFLFSQAFSESLPAWLNYGKIRAAYAEVGGDTDPYTQSLYYSMSSNTFNGIGLGDISGTVSPNSDIKPLKVKEAEAGFELILFDRRISLDFTAYRKNTVDEILNVDISYASSFGQTKVNVGRLRNQGIEALLTVVPVRTQNFSWESAFNYTYNESLVLELSSGQKKIDVGTGDFSGILSHEVGKPLGSLRGYTYKFDAQGRILTANGRFLQGDIVTFGSAIPKHIGGWLNTLNYKIFHVFAQIDFKAGHKMISNTNMNLTRHGLHKSTLAGREGGVVFDGYNVDGTPNTIAVESEAFYTDYRGKAIVTPFVYDASFIRWRNLSAGADLSRFVNRTFIKELNINAFINNFFIIKKSVDNLDPETVYSASDLRSGLESSALPTTRSYGINLNVKF